MKQNLILAKILAGVAVSFSDLRVIAFDTILQRSGLLTETMKK